MTDKLEELRDEVERLRERVATLEQRVDGSDGETIDRYDGYVLDQWTEGTIYTLADLQRLYRESGVRKKRTIKKRIKHLTQTYCRKTGTQQWEFVGGGKQ